MMSNEELSSLRKFIEECVQKAKNERKELLFKVMETFPRDIATQIVQSIADGSDPVAIVQAYHARVGDVRMVDDAAENIGKVRWIN